MKRFFLSMIFIVCSIRMSAQGPDVVIPAPAEVLIFEGTYSFDKNPKVRLHKMSQEVMPAEAYRLAIHHKKGVTIS